MFDIVSVTAPLSQLWEHFL